MWEYEADREFTGGHIALVVVGKPETSENRLFFCPRGKHQPIAFNIDAKVEFSTKRNDWYRTGQPAKITISKGLKNLKPSSDWTSCSVSLLGGLDGDYVVSGTD
jgi:hypothetical protein